MERLDEESQQKAPYMTNTILEKAGPCVTVLVVIIKTPLCTQTVSGCRELKYIFQGFMLLYQSCTR